MTELLELSGDQAPLPRLLGPPLVAHRDTLSRASCYTQLERMCRARATCCPKDGRAGSSCCGCYGRWPGAVTLRLRATRGISSRSLRPRCNYAKASTTRPPPALAGCTWRKEGKVRHGLAGSVRSHRSRATQVSACGCCTPPSKCPLTGVFSEKTPVIQQLSDTAWRCICDTSGAGGAAGGTRRDGTARRAPGSA